jgi:ABC-type multidrug transport system ATPase subunit
MIYGAAVPSEGTIRVFGTDVTRDPRAVRARLGVTLQENALIEVVSPLENLRIFGRYHLLGRDAIESRASGC